jgi:hypothetical protein
MRMNKHTNRQEPAQPSEYKQIAGQAQMGTNMQTKGLAEGRHTHKTKWVQMNGKRKQAGSGDQHE